MHTPIDRATDERGEPMTQHEQYIIEVRAQRIGNIMAYMGTIIARGLVLEQDEQFNPEQQP
jgi:hypothetical protein